MCAEPIKPPFVAGVAAQPLFLVKSDSQRKARRKSQENPQPGQHQVQLDNGRFHGAAIRFHAFSLTQLAFHLLIDKTSDAIVYINV